MHIRDILEEKRQDWPIGACSLFREIEDFSGTCGRCGWFIEHHEYLQECEHGFSPRTKCATCKPPLMEGPSDDD